MSSQLGQVKASTPVQPNPYANVPGYRPDEPANSAWNRTILSYKAAGVPYTIERQETGQAPSVKESSSVLGTPTSQTKSTNPALEEAIIGTFEREPSALKYAGNDQGSYLKGEYAKGVLTDLDFDKLNDIVNRYNANVAKENAKNFGLNQQNALGNGLISLSNKQIAAKNIQSGKEFSDFLQTYEKQNATFQIISKSGKVVGTTSGQRSYHDVLAAQKQFGQVKVQPILPGQQDTEKPFSIKEYLASSIGGFQKAVTTGKEANPVDYFIDVAKGAGGFFYQGTKQLAASAPIIGKEIFDTITTGRTQYQIKGSTPISGFAASFLQPSLGFTPAQKTQYQSNLNQIDSFIGSVRTQAKNQGLSIPSGILTPKEGSAGAAIGGAIGIGLGLYGLKEIAPIRVSTIAFEGVGKVASKAPAGPKIIEGPKTITIKGVTLGYEGPKAIGLFMKSSEGETYKLSKLSPSDLSPTLKYFKPSSERGMEFAGLTKLTQAKLLTSEGGDVLEKLGKFNKGEFMDLVVAAKPFAKASEKLSNVKISKAESKDIFQRMELTGNPDVNLQIRQQMGIAQSRGKSFAMGTGLLFKGNLEGAKAYGPFIAKPYAGAKGSIINISMLEKYNVGKSASERIPTKGVETIGDIDVDLASNKHASQLYNLFQKRITVPKGEGFGLEGRNISYGKVVRTSKAGQVNSIGHEVVGEKVINQLSKKDEVKSLLEESRATSGKVYGTNLSKKTINLGGFKTKTLSFQSKSLLKSLTSAQSRETLANYGGVETSKIEKGTLARFQGKENIVTTPFIRTKDILREYGIARYGEKTLKGKNSFIMGNYANALKKYHPYLDWKDLEAQTANVQYVAKNSKNLSNNFSAFGKSSSAITSTSLSSMSSKFSQSVPSTNISSPKSKYSKSSINSIISPASKPSKGSKSSKSPYSRSTLSSFSDISKPTSFRSPSSTPYKSPFSGPSPSPYGSPPSSPPKSPPYSPPTYPPSPPPGYPPFTKKKLPPGFPFGFEGENGPGSPVGGGGLKKNFLGNVPEFAFTGMFNKSEIKYAKAGGVPREYKSGKPAFNAFTKASGQQAGGKQKITAKSQESSFLFDKFSSQGKKSSKQSKPLSNKFNRLI